MGMNQQPVPNGLPNGMGQGFPLGQSPMQQPMNPMQQQQQRLQQQQQQQQRMRMMQQVQMQNGQGQMPQNNRQNLAMVQQQQQMAQQQPQGMTLQQQRQPPAPQQLQQQQRLQEQYQFGAQQQQQQQQQPAVPRAQFPGNLTPQEQVVMEQVFRQLTNNANPEQENQIQQRVSALTMENVQKLQGEGMTPRDGVIRQISINRVLRLRDQAQNAAQNINQGGMGASAMPARQGQPRMGMNADGSFGGNVNQIMNMQQTAVEQEKAGQQVVPASQGIPQRGSFPPGMQQPGGVQNTPGQMGQLGQATFQQMQQSQQMQQQRQPQLQQQQQQQQQRQQRPGGVPATSGAPGGAGVPTGTNGLGNAPNVQTMSNLNRPMENGDQQSLGPNGRSMAGPRSQTPAMNGGQMPGQNQLGQPMGRNQQQQPQPGPLQQREAMVRFVQSLSPGEKQVFLSLPPEQRRAFCHQTMAGRQQRAAANGAQGQARPPGSAGPGATIQALHVPHTGPEFIPAMPNGRQGPANNGFTQSIGASGPPNGQQQPGTASNMQPQQQPQPPRMPDLNGLQLLNPDQTAFMDQQEFPRQFLNRYRIEIPPSVTNWGQLKRWVTQNVGQLPQGFPGSLLRLQVAQFHQVKTRMDQQRRQGGGTGVAAASIPASAAPLPGPAGQMMPQGAGMPANPTQPGGQDRFDGGGMQGQPARPAMPNVMVSPEEIQMFRQQYPQLRTSDDEGVRRAIIGSRMRKMNSERTAATNAAGQQQQRQWQQQMQQQRQQQLQQQQQPQPNQQPQPPPQQSSPQPRPGSQVANGRPPPTQTAKGTPDQEPPKGAQKAANAPSQAQQAPPRGQKRPAADEAAPPNGSAQPQTSVAMPSPATSVAASAANRATPQNTQQSSAAPGQVQPAANAPSAGLNPQAARLRFEQLRMEVASTFPTRPPIPMDPETKAQMSAMLSHFGQALGRTQSILMAYFTAVSSDEQRMRQLISLFLLLLNQYTDRTYSTPKDQLTIHHRELLQAMNTLKHCFNEVQKRATASQQQALAANSMSQGTPAPAQSRPQDAPGQQQQQQQQSQQPQQPQPPQPPQPAAQPQQARPQQPQQQQQQAKPQAQPQPQKSHRHRDQEPPAPTSDKPPFSLFPPVQQPPPHGVPTYASTANDLTADKLQFPAHKRRKVNNSQTGQNTPVSAAASVASPSPKVNTQPTPTPKPVEVPRPFKCKVSDCESATLGFTTVEALSKHEEESHQDQDPEDPLGFALAALCEVLGLDENGKMPPKEIEKAPRMEKSVSAQSMPMKPSLSNQGGTPMSRAPTSQRSHGDGAAGGKSLQAPNAKGSNLKPTQASTDSPAAMFGSGPPSPWVGDADSPNLALAFPSIKEIDAAFNRPELTPASTVTEATKSEKSTPKSALEGSADWWKLPEELPEAAWVTDDWLGGASDSGFGVQEWAEDDILSLEWDMAIAKEDNPIVEKYVNGRKVRGPKYTVEHPRFDPKLCKFDP